MAVVLFSFTLQIPNKASATKEEEKKIALQWQQQIAYHPNNAQDIMQKSFHLDSIREFFAHEPIRSMHSIYWNINENFQLFTWTFEGNGLVFVLFIEYFRSNTRKKKQQWYKVKIHETVKEMLGFSLFIYGFAFFRRSLPIVGNTAFLKTEKDAFE